MIKIGVIGSGGMGSRHISNLHVRTPAEVVAVMDIDPSRAEASAEMVGGSAVYLEANALIEDSNVEAVVIASPDQFHAKTALACIAAGKPTLCEKPLALNLEDVQMVLDAELATGKRLIQLGYMREFDQAHRAVKDAADRGELGDLLVFHGFHSEYAPPEPRTTESVIQNSAIHDIHSARWFLQEEVEQVYVKRVVSDPARPETCRLLVVQLTFRNGSLGLIEMNSESGFGYQVEVELIGSEASVRTPRPSRPTIRKSGKEWRGIDDDWLERFDQAYINEAQVWVQSLIEGKPTGPSTWDGYADQLVADACIESFRSDKPQDVPKAVPPHLYT